jgi:hypothetical protein
MPAIPGGLKIYSTPIQRGGDVHITLDGIKPGHYAVRIFNSTGQLVFQKDMIIGVNFIDTHFMLPSILGTGAYSLQIWNPEFETEERFMIW